MAWNPWKIQIFVFFKIKTCFRQWAGVDLNFVLLDLDLDLSNIQHKYKLEAVGFVQRTNISCVSRIQKNILSWTFYSRNSCSRVCAKGPKHFFSAADFNILSSFQCASWIEKSAVVTSRHCKQKRAQNVFCVFLKFWDFCCNWNLLAART